MTEAIKDELGERIVAAGFAPNLAVLDINRSFDVPRDFALAAPWNLPSRMFRFPIEVCPPDGDQPRRIGLRHPLLAEHPYVRRVEAALGFEIDRNGAPNRFGYTTAPTARWWHAVDLISAGKWRELLETQDFTESGCIMRAVAYGCRYSDHEDKKAAGHINTAEARAIMREMGATEPDDRSAIIRAFSQPTICRQDNGSEHWPINSGPDCAEDLAWGFIIGVEDGWFSRDRSGYLQWSQLGRDRYAAGDSASFTESSGQAAFAF
ncbi:MULTISPECIES: hypothetical protein [Sphingomonadaceae]|jgi:hypothetical protein|uniref:Uncharacterized protein n=1 Tax=Novosphingobium panipatense TaxID=428991 RepID=A0ABY1QWG6_9SPHN|nr:MULTISPECIES: hypothetical protein [Sphingomonadaceae]SMP83120.1 hypothetical protein SAMN06296065_1405 [Novosphingobium panipatense]